MQVTLLGTGASQGVPMIGCRCEVCTSSDVRDRRLRSSLMVESEDTRIVIDTGPDFRYQMLRNSIDKIDGVLYTHEHKDHTGGMDDLRGFNYCQESAVDAYCDERTERLLRKDFDYAFASNTLPGVPQINIHTIDNKPFAVGRLTITPIQLQHFHLPVLGFRIGELCYITDCNHIPDEAFDKIRGCKVLIINALRLQQHISHFSLPEALAAIERIAPERTYLTHISHQLGRYECVSRNLPANVFVGYDQLRIEC